jgi:LytS/YehU family sensor histidine kinase
LPGLSLYTNPDRELPNLLSFFVSWLIASLSLYIIWQILWQLWEVESKGRRIGLILGLVVFIAVVSVILNRMVLHSIQDFDWILVARIITATALILVIQYALKAQQNVSRLLLEKEQMQTENYRTQLKALRAQIDPHFLFNSLNTLRSMVHQQHTNAEKFVISLSDFYRQTLKHNENTTLPLSKELDMLHSYLFLMKSRNVDAFSVNLNIDDSLNQFHLPSMALQIVVENCFKHNSMTSKNPLKIQIRHTDDNYILVSNKIQPRIGGESGLGLGLDLLRKRYALMNEEKGVIVEKTPDQFTVKLKLV